MNWLAARDQGVALARAPSKPARKALVDNQHIPEVSLRTSGVVTPSPRMSVLRLVFEDVALLSPKEEFLWSAKAEKKGCTIPYHGDALRKR